ncbi:uncharacterized protein CELE_W02D9.9 [Caenorhabditis elegans]|uniref:Secreted protein n=1 Tax=Caenorhabditis elegans TaxID=6239 RepID=Q9XVG6_CAEEL|nr:Secreted protein [Caenorhabditis elegans]CAB03467.2 Secreted protein [Caenorhabditis elegans]|eukprot:NP_493181.2 Uncharacterized protein CELE_W02D9.9 [Caenorhabditis elegans]
MTFVGKILLLSLFYHLAVFLCACSVCASVYLNVDNVEERVRNARMRESRKAARRHTLILFFAIWSLLEYTLREDIRSDQ